MLCKLPALSFSDPTLKEKVLDGSKRQTIRPLRKRPIKVGDILFLFYKQRTEECKSLGLAVCTEVFKVKFSGDRYITNVRKVHSRGATGGLRFERELARRDGFSNTAWMFEWFHERYGKKLFKLTFQVIRWEEYRRRQTSANSS